MQKTHLAKYQSLLEAKEAELRRTLGNLDEIAIQKAADAIDEVQLAAERELAITNLDRESKLLRMVKAALARLRDGSYGVCWRCEEPISPRRLEAVPWALYCVRCQESVDRKTGQEAEDMDEVLGDAA